MQNQLTERLLTSRFLKRRQSVMLFSALVGRLADFLQLNRLMTHLVILGVVAGVITIGGIRLSQRQLEARRYVPARLPVVLEAVQSNQTRPGNPLTLPGVLSDRTGVLRPAPVPHTIIPDRTVRIQEIQSYPVQSGDTVYGIALKFGLDPETIVWANNYLEDNPDLLQVGEKLTILPVNGVYHQVGGSDTISSIAASFKVEAEAIVNYSLNNLDPTNPVIYPGQWLIVPGGIKPYVPKYVPASLINAPTGAQQGTGSFSWPASGSITQDYWSGHRAIDISAWSGAPIYAADAGYVVGAGWDDSGYGRMVVIDHGNGIQTLYAHMNAYYVSVGDEVAQGQQIGEMGKTGHATGPHLHFEVIVSGTQRNPWGFLP
jgi:murein DD-endopeptidase MepM/ murein hydrolase activator NlpD